jgi:hypothetical protein
MTRNFNQTVACPKCHHADHAISEELHTFRLFYGQVAARRSTAPTVIARDRCHCLPG